MPSDNPAKITIKRRERDAVLQALQAGPRARVSI